MRVGYFISRFPEVSQTFILREIDLLRARGVQTPLFAIRRPVGRHILDDRFAEAATETDYILDDRFFRMLTVHVRAATSARGLHLDAIHERKGIDIHVASVSLIRHKETNQVRSYCVWAEGVDTLLPEADDVVFQRADSTGGPDPKSPPLVAPWSAVRSRLEHLMEPADGYPVRYRVKTYPSSEILREIAKEIGT